MRKHYWVTVEFRDNHETIFKIKRGFYTTSEKLHTEVNIFIERLMEENPVFKYMYRVSTITEVRESD